MERTHTRLNQVSRRRTRILETVEAPASIFRRQIDVCSQMHRLSQTPDDYG